MLRRHPAASCSLVLALLVPMAGARPTTLDDALARASPATANRATAEAIDAVAASGDERALDASSRRSRTASSISRPTARPTSRTRPAISRRRDRRGRIGRASPSTPRRSGSTTCIRDAIDAALGALAADVVRPGKRRIAAAEAVFKSRDASALPALEKAIAAEKDPAVKRVQLQARAAVILAMPDASEADMLAAVDVHPRPRRPGRAGAADKPAADRAQGRARRGRTRRSASSRARWRSGT